MTRLIGEPVKAHTDKNSMISAFIWRKRLYRVTEVISWWREPPDWWTGQVMRFFVRVNAKNTSEGTYELYRIGDSWFLHRVLD